MKNKGRDIVTIV